MGQGDNGFFRIAVGPLVVGALIGLSSVYFAGASAGVFDVGAIDTGDTAWILAAAALMWTFLLLLWVENRKPSAAYFRNRRMKVDDTLDVWAVHGEAGYRF